MTPFFVRLTFAFKTFFSILFRNHIPSEAAALFGPAPAAPVLQEPRASSATQSNRRRRRCSPSCSATAG